MSHQLAERSSNYNKVLKELSTEELNNIIHEDCECEDSQFIYDTT